MIRKYFGAFALLIMALSVQAKELKGVSFDDEMTVMGTKLKLNGLGVRKAYSIFDVYVAGLYVEKPSKDADAILKLETPKYLVLKFKTFVDKGKMKDAWALGFQKNADKSYEYRKDLNTFNAETSNMKKGDEIKLTLYKDKAEVQFQDKPVVAIAGADFSITLLKVFIGDPPDEDLKNGLLGK